MKPPRCLTLLVLCLTATLAFAQPSFTGPALVPTVIEDAALRRTAFLARRDEVIALLPPDLRADRTAS